MSGAVRHVIRLCMTAATDHLHAAKVPRPATRGQLCITAP